ncbi:MAG: host-nuclease inhibitor Gam family protein [Bacteroidaceae bacterium]|nr:host-nuclease inhibitor Gam family protein [Bacteroidaceae bacterium]
MAKRQKKTVITGVTREAAEEAFAQYAKADAQIEKINAEIDLQCAKIREKYQSQLGTLACDRECAFDTLQAYATENQAELFSKKKSLDMAHGTIGFRTGTPKLKTLKGFTWASALTLVKKYMPGYVRTSEEIAKDKLLADRELEAIDFVENGITKKKESMSAAMAECGIIVAQDEAFYVEPKKEDTDQ